MSSPGISLPENFAVFTDNSTVKSPNRTESCMRKVAVVFHVFNNSKLFQSSSGQTENLELPSDHLLLGEDLSVVNSLVLSATLSGGLDTDHLKTDAELLFKEIVLVDSKAKCSFWDGTSNGGFGKWSREGCHLVKSVDNRHVCSCNHLTNFAILMDVTVSTKTLPLPKEHQRALTAISYVGCSLSSVALIITLITVFAYREQRKNKSRQVLAGLSLSLLMTYIFFMIGLEGSPGSIACKATAIIVHYFLLSAFCWMLVEGVTIYLGLHKSMFLLSRDINVKQTAAFAWGFPTAIVGITVASDHSAYNGKSYCRLETPAFYVAFLGPILLIVTINTVILLKCMITLSSQLSTAARAYSVEQATAKKAKGGLGLMFLLGLTWLIGIPMMDDAKLAFQYIFAVLNTLQGVAIFTFQLVLNKEIRRRWSASASSFRHKSSNRSSSAQQWKTLFTTSTTPNSTLIRSSISCSRPSSTASNNSLYAQPKRKQSSKTPHTRSSYKEPKRPSTTSHLSAEGTSNWILMVPERHN